MMTQQEKLKVIRLSSFLSMAPANLLSAMARNADVRSYERGDFIYSREEPADLLYVLVDGKIGYPEIQEIDSQFPTTSEVSARGQLFGFAALVPGPQHRVISARCIRATRVLAIEGQWLQSFIQKHGQEGHELLQQLTHAFAGHEHAVSQRSGWLSIRNAAKVYGRAGKAVRVLDDVSIEIRPGEFCAVLGPPNCGKSTLINAVAGFESLTEGIVYLDGECINRPGQKPRPSSDRIVVHDVHSLSPWTSVRKNLIRDPVAEGRMSEDTALTKVRELLGRFGLSSVEDRHPRDLSAANCHRVEIARALFHDPRVILLDDPLRKLDESTRSSIHDEILDVFTPGATTTLFATRNLEEALYLADRVLIMTTRPGRICQTLVVDLPRNRDARSSREFQDLVADAKNVIHEENVRIAKSAIIAVSSPPTSEPSSTNRGNRESREKGPYSDRTKEQQSPVMAPVLQSAGINAFEVALRDRQFLWTIEFIPSRDKILRDELHKLGGIAEVMREHTLLKAFSVTDRVVSDHDPDPVAAAAHLLDHSGKQPLVHFSGKGRDIRALPAWLERLREDGLNNVLFLTGDAVKNPIPGKRARHLESVAALAEAKLRDPELLAGCALNPFKYREEDAMAQYLKLGKKVAAGADFVITQIGYDPHKYAEAAYWVDSRNYSVPLIANVMPLTAARARYMRHHQLPGVTITDPLLALLETEERTLADRGKARVLRRLALQILGVRQLGYAGVQITGLHSTGQLQLLEQHYREVQDLCTDRIDWKQAWAEAMSLPEGGQANPSPIHEPWYMINPHQARPRRGSRVKYRVMDKVHDLAFDRGPLAGIIGLAVRSVSRHSTADRMFECLERAIKKPLFGCETCGMCRLAATQYVCPETCPKGLANGACGGTSENLCEFRDRECIHSHKYRLAKELGLLEQIETCLIPAVPADIRHTSSWPPHFRGEGPKIRIGEPVAAESLPTVSTTRRPSNTK
jgi:ABC-type nitrate/sulfonate/bicarbonate transport system ATPase subunit/5,10-methylenetetrahydrofolate reductase